MQHKITCFLLTLFFHFGGNAQTNLKIGKGILMVQFEHLKQLDFYTDTLTKKPAKIIEIIHTIDEYSLRDKDSALRWFAPETAWLDYSFLHLRVEKSIGNWHQVFVNNESRTKMWIRKNPQLNYISWPAFMLNHVSSVNQLDTVALDIRLAPALQAKVLRKSTQQDCWEVLEIKGEWMKIQTHTKFECDITSPQIKNGWIRWRNKNKLLIYYSLTC